MIAGKNMKTRYLSLAVLFSLLLATGCASQPEWARYELCFGLSADSGNTRISDEQWQEFRDHEISSRFPDGYTVTPGTGYWRNQATTYSEPAEILLVTAPDTTDTRKKLDEIASAFARKFIQDSVLEIKSPANVEFHRYP